MAWDVSTDPRFQEQLDGMDVIVREEIGPLETIVEELGQRGPDEVHRQSVARLIKRGFEPPPDGVPTQNVPARRELAQRRFAHLLDVATSAA